MIIIFSHHTYWSRIRRFTVIAVGTQEKLEHAPDLPTFIENVYNITLGLNHGYVAPKGRPQEIIDRSGKIFEETANDPTYIEAVTDAGAGIDFMGPEEYRAHLEEQDAIIKEVIAEINDFNKLSKQP